MNRDDRLAALLGDLQHDIDADEVGEHRRHVRVDDAADVACALHGEMDTGVATRSALARRDGITIACAPGCAACCENLIMVWEPEALAVVRFLERPETESARARFVAAYPAWRDQVGEAPEHARRLHLSGERRAYEDTVQAVWRKRIMCAFNADGACSVYPVRPNVCRNCHATDTAEHCGADSEIRPKAVEFPPLAQFLRKSQALTTALQVTMRGRNDGPAALCSIVYDMLTGAAARAATAGTAKTGRNEPCPCGSGNKYKRCCGR